MQDRHAIAARARLAHRRARDQAAEPALAEPGQGRHVINAGDPGAEKERARRRRLAVDAREKVAERRLRPEPDRHRQLGKRLAKRPRCAERIAQHAAPVRQRRGVFNGLDRECRFRRAASRAEPPWSSRSAAIPRAASRTNPHRSRRSPRSAGSRRRPRPPQHRHIAGRAGGEARVDQRADAIARPAWRAARC